MRLEFKLLSHLALAVMIFGAAAARAEAVPQKMVDVPLRDMRKDSAAEVQKRAVKDSRDGIVLVYSGETTQLEDTVRHIAGECAARGFQVRSVLLANSQSGDGVTMYGQDGGPLGPKVKLDGDMKSQTADQIERLRERLARVPTLASTDPLDVVRCRYESTTGSLVRKTKVCSTPRQDAERRQESKDWTQDQQNQGAEGPDPIMGQ